MAHNTMTFKNSPAGIARRSKARARPSAYPRYTKPGRPANFDAANRNSRPRVNKLIRHAVKRSGRKIVTGAALRAIPIVGVALVVHEIWSIVNESNNPAPAGVSMTRHAGGWTYGNTRRKIDYAHDGWQGVSTSPIIALGYQSFYLADTNPNRNYLFPRAEHITGNYYRYRYSGVYVSGTPNWPYGVTKTVTSLPAEYLNPRPYPPMETMPVAPTVRPRERPHEKPNIVIEASGGQPVIRYEFPSDQMALGTSGRDRGRGERKSNNQYATAAVSWLLDFTSETYEAYEILLEHFGLPERTPIQEALPYMAEHWESVNWAQLLFDIWFNIQQDKIWGRFFDATKPNTKGDLGLTTYNVSF